MAVANSHAIVKKNTAFLVQGLSDDGTNWEYVLLTIRPDGIYGRGPINPTGSLWRAGGFTAYAGLDWHDANFTGPAIHTKSPIWLDHEVAGGDVHAALVFTVASAADNTTTSIIQRLYNGDVQSRIDFIANSGTDVKSGIAFTVHNGGLPTERARFALGSGNFLIGTTTDAGGNNKLQVAGDTSVSGLLTVGGDATIGGNLHMTHTGSADVEMITVNVNAIADNVKTGIAQKLYTGDTQGRIDFISNSSSNIQAGMSFSVHNGASLVERARFAVGSGNFLIGTTTDIGGGATLQVTGNALFSGQIVASGLISAANCSGQANGVVIATTGTGVLVRCP